MRVKVTGEDSNRNGPSMSSGGQLMKAKQHPNSLIGRRISLHHRKIPTQVIDDNNGQDVAAPQYVEISTRDGKSIGQVKFVGSCNPSSSLIKSHPGNTIPTTVIAGSGESSQASSQNNKPIVSSQAIQAAITQYNENQPKASEMVEKPADVAFNTPIVIKITSIQAAPHTQLLAEQLKDHESVTSSNDVPKDDERVAVAEISLVETAENSSSTQAAEKPCTLSAPEVETILDKSEMAVSPKQSREMKLLKQTHTKSKMLTEFMTETSRKGKLRKRRSESNCVPTVPADTGAHLGPRKRQRSRSAANSNTNEDIVTGLENDSSMSFADYDESDLVVRSSSNRKMRSLKSDYSLQKPSNTNRSDRSVSKDYDPAAFLSLVDLNPNSNEEDETVCPGDPPKPGWDRFCWRCKRTNPELGCSKCTRSYHKRCVRYTVDNPNWSCAECKTTAITSRADAEFFTQCLGYVLDILELQNDWSDVFNPLNITDLKDYDKYINHHMDLAVMYERLAQRKYKAPEEFVSDLSWIVHNMSIYPGPPNLVKIARAMHKRGKQEIEEIDPCYECYVKANNNTENWFIKPCSKPHLLVWAKLKGYPYWPAKLYGVNANNQAQVRFFGAHDRAWIPVKDCFLYAQQDPNPQKMHLKSKQMTFAHSLADMEQHIDQLREQFKTFNYAESFESVNPSRHEDQLRAMLPGAFVKKVKVTIKRNEGEMTVAVASSSCNEPQSSSQEKANTAQAEKASPSTEKGTKFGKTVSPRKRMTRRMSRILKNPDESAELANTSKDSMDDPDVSLSSSNDKTSDSNVASSKPADNKRHRLNDGREELSLLIRRGSQSWETEPLSKRRKSTVDKSVLKASGSKTTKPNTKAVPPAAIKDTVLPAVAQEETEVSKDPVPVEESTIPVSNADPIAMINEPLPVQPAENVVPPVQPVRTNVTKHALVSIPADSTASFITQKEKDTSKSMASTVEAGGPATVSTAITVSSIAPSSIVNSSDMSGDISIKEEIISDDEILLVNSENTEPSATKKLAPKGKQPSSPAEVSSSPAVTTLNVATSSEEMLTVPLPVSSSVAKAIGDSSSHAAMTDPKTKQRVPMPINTAIKSRFNDDSNDTQKVSSNQLAPMSDKTMAKANDSSTSTAVTVGASSHSTATLPVKSNSIAVTVGSKRQQVVLPPNKISKENTTNVTAVSVGTSVAQVPVVMFPASNNSNSTAVSVVPSNQRARKSFPGGTANAKTAKQATHNTTLSASSVPNVLVKRNSTMEHLVIDKVSENATATKSSREINISCPTTTPIQSATPFLPQRVAELPNRTGNMSNCANANSNGAGLATKQLVPASTTISLIPCEAERNSEKNETNASSSLIDIDNDDIMIIDEDIQPTAVSSGSSSVLPLPPLVPRPQLQSANIQPSDREESPRPTDLLNDCAGQLLDSFRLTIENVLSDLADKGSPSAEVSTLKIKLDRIQKQRDQHATELEAQRKLYEGMMQELRQSLEQEKKRAMIDQRQQLMREKQRAVQLAKQKQWCKRCLREAKFYCCWNTSYCEVSCQEKHWDEHKDVCNQAIEKKARSSLPMSIVPVGPDHCWAENDNDHRTPEPGRINRPVLPIPATTSVTISPDNKSNMRKHATAAAATGPRGIGSPDNGGRKHFTSSPSTASPSARGESNSINTSIPNNGVLPAATSTPFHSSGRSYPSGNTSVANVSFNPPTKCTVKAVYGGVGYSQHPAHNGGNVTTGLTTGGALNMPQQHQQRMNTTRDKSTPANNRAERRDNPAAIKVSQAYVPTNTYDLTMSPARISTVLQPITSTTSSMSMPTFGRTTIAGDIPVTGVSQHVWNQIAMQASGIRQSQLGTSGSLDRREQGGQLAVEFRSIQHHPTVSSQKQKPAREQ
uniref:Protein kinase C-binding protein 1 n=1 Tax=Anopheles christyi TaxID=43041 RepID=A0A182JQ06_9DIPT